jgi:spore coat polysaccharide biosynthesis predicted glycosyltransferase SpsG
MSQKILFVSGSLGLGHVTRDIAIARELRKIDKDVELVWLADPPATTYLREAGEKVFPDLESMSKGTNELADSLAGDYALDLNVMFMAWYQTFPERVKAIKAVAERENVDLVVGDETYDLYCEYAKHPKLKTKPFLLMLDFIGAYLSEGQRMNLAFYMFQRWTSNHLRRYQGKEGTIFIGLADDVPADGLGFLLPNRREVVKRYGICVGYALTFDPAAVGGRDELRKKLGYGPEPLVLVTVGGTAVAAPLLKKAAEAYPFMKKTIPDLRMVLVLGPRVPMSYVKPVDGITVKGLVPNLYEHLAAADLVISAGGGTTTNELQVLNKPFIYFPLEQHFEQQINVAYHLKRDSIGVNMVFSKTTPERLASVALENIGKTVTYPKLPVDGARKTAEHINGLLDRIKRGELKA